MRALEVEITHERHQLAKVEFSQTVSSKELGIKTPTVPVASQTDRWWSDNLYYKVMYRNFDGRS